MADNSNENNITYDTELTPEEKQEVQEALKSLTDEDVQADEDFIKNVYGQADNNMSEVYTENKKNKESILDKISKVLLYYTIIDSVLKLTKRQENHLFSSFSKTITDMFKEHTKLAQNVTENTLNKAFDSISDRYNLKHSQKQREKLVNQKYFGKHFSERIWDDEQKVAKAIQLEMKNFLKGKVNANQIVKRIQLKFDTNEYNAKRLTDTELSRIQNELFRQNCQKTGAKYVLYKATFCRTCKTCRSHHNITYKLDYAPLIPVHPSCRCFYSVVNSNYFKHEEEMKISKKDIVNAYSVNRSVVNSKQYHDKFENLDLNKNVRESLYKESKKILEHRDGTGFEDLVILDSKTGNEIAANRRTNDNLKTGISKDEYEKVMKNPNSIILLHNHPGGGRLSKADIFTAFKNPNVKMSIVAGHDGKIHYIKNMNRKYDIENIYLQKYNEYKKIGFPDGMAILKATDDIYSLNAFDYEEI